MVNLLKFDPQVSRDKSMHQTHWTFLLFARLHQKCVQPILGVFQSGLTPSKLSLSLVMGMFCGLCPIPGTTTLLCGFLAFRLRLNFAVMQTMNYAVSPLQYLLLIPFIKMGACLLPDASIPFSVSELIISLQHTPYQTIQHLWQVLLSAVVAWFMLCLPLAWISYRVLKSFLQRKFVTAPAL
ncbi:MAG: DUF2062 domain-containing protein [Candidatus Latescibacteria bacterium]|jgi:uncharacterized protein (DUF2062 family)|nr:DUF2062 domain-containing protein [Candidatus Latescibacterota bacterium]